MGAEHIIQFFAEHYGWIPAIMSVLIAIAVEGIKIPVKKLTAKITDEKLRKLANKSIILITFGLAFLLDYLASLIMPNQVTFDTLISTAVGGLANLLYALSEGLITIPMAESKAKQIVSDPTNAIESSVVDEADETVEEDKEEVKEETEPAVEETAKKISSTYFKNAKKSEAVKNFEKLTK